MADDKVGCSAYNSQCADVIYLQLGTQRDQRPL